MLNSILVFIQNNSFVLGLLLAIITWLQSRFFNTAKLVDTLRMKVLKMEERFIDIEEKRILTLEKRFDSLFEKYNELAQVISEMRKSIQYIEGGISRIEDILMKR